MFLIAVMRSPTSFIVATCEQPAHLRVEECYAFMADDIVTNFDKVAPTCLTFLAQDRTALKEHITRLREVAKACKRVYVHLSIVPPNFGDRFAYDAS